MARRAIVFAFALAGCATAQDLGEAKKHDAPRPPTTGGATAAPSAPTPAPAPVAEPEPDRCPAGRPADRTPCDSNALWCTYPLDDLPGLSARCSCVADRRWTCVVARDVLAERRAPEILPVTAIACAEGAPCRTGMRCTVPQLRTCVCRATGFECDRLPE
jgi:hypothetical protein